METEVVSGLTAYGPGYINEEMKDLEQVVGLQTDKPLKRAFMPYGGIKMAVQACENYGYKVNPELIKIFTEYHKTHNAAVFDAYTPEMLKARHNKIITGLPDTYGRGRIVGDYRRVALYGIDHLIEGKKEDKAKCGSGSMKGEVIRLREEIAEQIRSLENMKKMAQIYGYDISRPAKNAKEAVQWLYFGYLAGGVGMDEEGGRLKLFFRVLCFTLGISGAFFVLGLGASAAGKFFSEQRMLFARIGGILIILFGLYQLGVFGSSKVLGSEHRIPLKMEKMTMSPITALIMGFAFSFAWTPCVGPALTSSLPPPAT